MLEGKKILLGVTGSIAAYKAAILIRLLIKENSEVKVVMTPLAKEFITPLTLATLSKNPILIDFFNPENGAWNSHVDLGTWADAMIIAPATANSIGKMANGIADNLLMTTYMSLRCPVFVAPAMDLDMYMHPSNQKNLEILKSFGNTIIEPGFGALASGLEGKGRMEEPDVIVKTLKEWFDKESVKPSKKKLLKGKKILVSAGPTQEPIDPVRYISNHSSGKMGYAIANELDTRGAEVYLVSGPVSQMITNPSIKLIKVITAKEMHEACTSIFPSCDAAIMCAAVADYAPEKVSGQKIKKGEQLLTLTLSKNPDVLSDLGKVKQKKQILVGFALETEDEVENAKRKINKKNLDFIVLNSLNDTGAGFKYDTNRITIIDRNNNVEKFELRLKTQVAVDIVDKLSQFLNISKIG